MRFLTREQVFKKMEQKRHVVFQNDSRNFNLNIIGIRSLSAKMDEFGCQLMVAWKFDGEWNSESFRITTYPGRHYMMQKLLNPAGCAILVPDQYRNVYGIRKHGGKYDALCQTWGDVKVFRDKDKDDQFDLNVNTVMEGSFGINIHNSPDNKTTTRVGAYSAGCQVFSDDKEFARFMFLCYKARENFGNKFTYTLLDQ